MGGCMSTFMENSGDYEPPGSRAVAAFLAEREGIVQPAARPQTPPGYDEPAPPPPIHASPPSPRRSPTQQDAFDKASLNSRQSSNKNIAPPLEPSLVTPANTVVFRKKKPARSKSTPHPRVPLREESPPIDDGYSESGLSFKKDMAVANTMPSSPNKPTRSQTMAHTSRYQSPPESPPIKKDQDEATSLARVQSEILGELYALNIPASEIALVVKTMRGEGSRDEEAVLLQRLYGFSVPSALIARVVDAMRASQRQMPSRAPGIASGSEVQVLRNLRWTSLKFVTLKLNLDPY